MERKYMMYEGEDVNTIDLLYEMPTTERNGVKVIVPVNWRDRQSFFTKIKEQLAYFENVFFDVVSGTEIIDNNFKIYRNEFFQYSQLSKDSNLHLCLDNVYYPIDFGKLDIGSLDFPVALRFSLTDGIYPTPNREAIRYTAETKAKILNRIREMSDFFIDKYNQTAIACKSFMDVHEYYNSNKRMVKLIDGVDLNVHHLSVLSNKMIEEPKLEGVQHLNLKRLVDKSDKLFKEYGVTGILNRGKIKEVKATSYEHTPNLNRFNGKNFYFYKDRISELKKSYLRNSLPNSWKDNFHLIKKNKSFTLFNKSKSVDAVSYYSLLDLKKIERKHWRAAIVEFQKLIEKIVSEWISVDDLVVPDHFVQMHNLKNKKISKGKPVRYKGEDIALKFAIDREGSSDTRSCKFESQVWRLKDISTCKKLVVYGHHDISVANLDPLYSIMKKRKVDIISLSQREMKVLKECEFKNVISFDEFMKGECGPFKRAVTAYLCKQLMIEYDSVFRKIPLMEKVNKKVADLMLDVKQYVTENYIDGNKDLYKAMIEVANQKKLYDNRVHTHYLKLKAFLNDVPRIDLMFNTLDWSYYATDRNEVSVELMVTYMKYHKKKVNLGHYKKPKQVVENQ